MSETTSRPEKHSDDLPSSGESDTPAHLGLTSRGLRDHKLASLALLVLGRYWLVLFLIIEVVTFSVMRPDTFLSVANIQTISLQQVEPLIAALALIFPLIVGEFDLSVGAVATASAVVAASLMRDTAATPLALLAALGVAAVVGVIVGMLVARFEVNSLIGTLGATTVIAGLISQSTGGLAVNENVSPWLTNLAQGRILGIPTLVIVAAALALFVWFVLQQTVYGRQLSALGANRRAAELLGLNARRLILSTFVFSALLAGLAGLVQVSVEAGANPASGGIALVISSLTAVFLGATCFRPGHFNVAGTIVGLFFLAFGVSGLSLIGLAAWVQNVFTGISLIVALAVAAAFRRAAA